MKPNKEKIYDFIKLHSTGERNKGVSTQYIAEALNMQRSNVSSALNMLVKEKRISKGSGRPVLYHVSDSLSTQDADCFKNMIGYDGSVKRAIHLAEAAVLYPDECLNAVIIGEKGTGKKLLAEMMYKYAVSQGLIVAESLFNVFDCKDYENYDSEKFSSIIADKHSICKSTSEGLLYINHIEKLSNKNRKLVYQSISAKKNCKTHQIVVISCSIKEAIADDDFMEQCPIIIELPSLAERPLKERMKIVQKFFMEEALRIKRTLTINEDLMRCLLLYECRANCLQLKADIKTGCANAYVRQYKNSDNVYLLSSDFEHYVRKGFLKYNQYKDEIEQILPLNYSYSFSGTTLKLSTVNNVKEQKKDTVMSEKADCKPVILLLFYGENVAYSLVKTIVEQTSLDNIFDFELHFEKDAAETYDSLKKYIMKINRGKGLIVVYDSSFLSDMIMSVEEELNIVIREFPMPITSICTELGRKAEFDDNVDMVYESVINNMDMFNISLKKIIVILCTTGKGCAEELRQYIKLYGKVDDMELVTTAITDSAALKEEFALLMKRGSIQCVVGTYDPKMFSLPFISISDVFGTPKDRLPSLLRLNRNIKKSIDYNAIIKYLSGQLTNIDMDKIKKIMPAFLGEVNSEICELSLDSEVGLFIHTSCCIDRLSASLETPVNMRKESIIKEHYMQYKKLLKILKPMEKSFGVIFSDDEIANILTIIFKL